MIDPLAVVIAHLATDTGLAALVSTRIAAKHKFGLGAESGVIAADAWPTPSQALRVQTTGGQADWNSARQVADVTATCFGSSQQEAMAVYLALVARCRATERTRVPTATGDGLLYFLLVTSAPIVGFETLGEASGIDSVTATLRCAVAECPIPA